MEKIDVSILISSFIYISVLVVDSNLIYILSYDVENILTFMTE